MSLGNPPDLLRYRGHEQEKTAHWIRALWSRQSLKLAHGRTTQEAPSGDSPMALLFSRKTP